MDSSVHLIYHDPRDLIGSSQRNLPTNSYGFFNWACLAHSSTSLPLRPSFRSCVTVSSSRHNALIIISEKMASIRRILQTGQTGNLANASYQQPRRATLKHFVCSFGVMMAWRRILATGFYFLIFTQLLASVAGQFSLQTVTNYLISDDR